ncbi:MAG: DNA-directed RNA polymerase subunit omega [Actinobacteria bacterium]|nr:MAG: DNA-directed RNA polymerase subunit omega [Actinomycetota bacterium]
MQEPEVDVLLEKVDSKFTLVIASAKRARQINDYFNAMRHQQLVQAPGPQVEGTTSKPLSIALKEVAEGKCVYERVADGIK